MSEKLDPVQLALAIRRGQLRLRDLPPADQTVVRAVLNGLTDGQAQTILSRAEKRAQYRGREQTALRKATA